MKTKAVLVAAPASGQGKTTVACALARRFARAGQRVRAFKCGPDFLDPTWLALASAAPVDSLDLWINGEADCAQRLNDAAQAADLVVVEGVMGLYDGQPSAADLARRFGLPVLAVVDAGAMAGTFGAIVHGLRHWPGPGRDAQAAPAPLPWAGVLANRVGSARHAAMLAEALAPADAWRGALPRDAALALPERHLGLAAAAELPDALARLDAAADALARTALATLESLPDWPGPGSVAAPAAPPRLLAGRRIAIARDAAFAFIYPANLQVLQALGAELSFFSPLAGQALPPCDALWLPGGYPELHAARLAANDALRDQVAAHLALGRPLWAECGGMMALAETLVDGQGVAHRLWDLLPGTATLGRRIAALGPQALQIGGRQLRGHSFHWSSFESPLRPWAHTVPARVAVGRDAGGGGGGGGGGGEPVYQQGSLRASWFHPWFASAPEAAAQLFLPGVLA
ncbi:cobyrinate a,c-diamide synthase [Aquabacterium sp. OR-4]|uniref:cobyrinate a,c-diamide synthase n=1 Tax=Aquabacterium sp. OR-4 TaxID=2978127 RepID=UPI0021B2CE80|nr:cobyrinate a,c-diamide synthase [Aquabacterium sp. OR-4]MDT7836132.1 cobyrinate a,c-diamide synthase [Aquabacterium sp. OR-4]